MQHVTVERGRIVNVDHAEREVEAGFDLTDFGDAQRFGEMLESLDLDPFDDGVDHGCIDTSREQDGSHGLFVFANDRVALFTGNNPLTGEYGDPGARPDEKGYASYIGISGTHGAVQEVFEAVQEHAKYVKGRDPRDRSFI